MYTIFIKNKPVFLTEANNFPCVGNNRLRLKCHGTKDLEQALEEFEKHDFLDSLSLTCSNPEDLLQQVKNMFQVVEAAGGLVINAKGELLMILRKGFWDLPKGKRDEGESLEQTAIREVEEECGISHLKITGNAGTTYHVYEESDNKILKVSHWFHMTCADENTPVPQTSEQITEVKWMNAAAVSEAIKCTYPSIKALLQS